MIEAMGAERFLMGAGGASRQAPKIVMDEYIRCWTKKTITGACRDYRAFATIDFEMDAADKDRQIGMPQYLGNDEPDESRLIRRKA